MSKIETKIDCAFTITLNYEQAKALDAMAGYGADNFLKAFKEKLGSHYIEPYESGIRSLFDEIRGTGKPIQTAIHGVEATMKKLEKLADKEL